MRSAQSIEIALDTDEDGSAAPLTTPAEGEDLSGLVLGRRYRLLRLLGRGGMGAVYLAEHVTLEKRFAIKILSAHRSADDNLAIQRFVREARATCLLRHEHVVDVCDFGTSGGRVYLVMEHLEGEDLAAILRRDGPMPWPRVARILLQICSALQVAHARQIVHRDIKPSNCFLVAGAREPDCVKVLDFGVAKVLRGGFDDGAALETDASTLIGTPEYMAPECLERGAIDARVDVYSVGMLGYHLLTGRLPFSRAHEGIFDLVRTGTIIPPRRAAPQLRIPVEAESIVMRALRPQPADRFQSIAELAAAISAVLDPLHPILVRTIDEEAQTMQFPRRPRTPTLAPRRSPAASEHLSRIASGLAGALALFLAFAVWSGLTAQPDGPPPAPLADPEATPPSDASDDLEIVILDDPPLPPPPVPEPELEPVATPTPPRPRPPSPAPPSPPRDGSHRVPLAPTPLSSRPPERDPAWDPDDPLPDLLDPFRPGATRPSTKGHLAP